METRDAAREAEEIADVIDDARNLERLLDEAGVPRIDDKEPELGELTLYGRVCGVLAEIAALRRALEPLARVALPEDFHPGAPGEPAEDGWCNIYTGGLTNGDIRRARKLVPTPSAGGANG